MRCLATSDWEETSVTTWTYIDADLLERWVINQMLKDEEEIITYGPPHNYEKKL